MRDVDRDLDRILNQLRARFHEQGYTQLEVQKVLGWGRSYISQLLTKQKSLRFDQVLMILNVIGVKPEDFWAEIFPSGPPTRARSGFPRHAAPRQKDAANPEPMLEDMRRTKTLLEGVVTVLTRKNLITAGELAGATKKFR